MAYAFVKFYRGGANYHLTTTTSGGVDGPDLAAIALGLWAVGMAPS
jgi:hypothetical protein